MADIAASAPVAAQPEQDTKRDQTPPKSDDVAASEDVEMKDAPAGGTLLPFPTRCPFIQVNTTR